MESIRIPDAEKIYNGLSSMAGSFCNQGHAFGHCRFV
jgi:hypothetical protein